MCRHLVLFYLLLLFHSSAGTSSGNNEHDHKTSNTASNRQTTACQARWEHNPESRRSPAASSDLSKNQHWNDPSCSAKGRQPCPK